MLGHPKYHSQFYEQLLGILGEPHVSIREIDRITYARDANFQSTIQVRGGHFPYHPDLIAWPKGAEQVAKVVSLARRYKVPIIPYGGGSGVCGGTVPTKGGLIIDMKRNARLLELNKKEGWICVETGIYGQQLENVLNRKGYTLGHFPSSIYCSTVGGWLAARSAGQFSSRYGKIEDMALSLEVVTPTGSIVTTSYAKNLSNTMDWNQLFIGTEGTLGVITKAWLWVHTLPEKRLFRGMMFPTLDTGMSAIRRIMQSGLEPALLRLYDALDSTLFMHDHSDASWFKTLTRALRLPFSPLLEPLKGWGTRRAAGAAALVNHLAPLLPSQCLLILGYEGDEETTSVGMQACIESALEEQGEDLGPEIGNAWFAHRYDVSYAASPLFYQGAFVDTIEVATTWDRLKQLYYTVKRAIEPHALVMAHLSHSYTAGCSIYFTFVGYATSAPKSEALFDTIWKQALTACTDVGGVISHHHGIGRLKVDFMHRAWNEGIDWLHAFKDAWDPSYLMNPGKLIPSE